VVFRLQNHKLQQLSRQKLKFILPHPFYRLQFKLEHLKIIQLLSIICFFMYCCVTQAQNIAVGDWQSHLPFQNVKALTSNGEQIIAGTFGGVLYFNPADNSVERLSTVNGLSGVDVVQVDYNITKNLLIIGYNNFNIDIYDGNTISTFSDIKNSSIQGQKRLNKIYSTDSLTYLCGTFGVLAVDIDSKVVLENYTLTDGSSIVEAYDIILTAQHIFVATDKGVYQADKNNPNLFNADEWLLHDMEQNILPGAVTKLDTLNNQIYAIKGNEILSFDDEAWSVQYIINETDIINDINIQNDIIYLSTQSESSAKVISLKNKELIDEFTYYTIRRPNDIIFINQSIFVGDFWNGINKIENSTFENFQPNGPRKQDNYALTVDENNILWVAGGAAPGNYDSNISYSDAGVYTYDNISWFNQNKYTLGQEQFVDIISVEVNPQNGKAFLGTYIYGVFELNTNDGSIKQLTEQNSGLQRSLGNEIGVVDMAFDTQNNLWMSNIKTEKPIKVLMAEGEWHSFKPDFNPPTLTVTKIMTSKFYNHVWVVYDRQGILVYNYGNDIASTADDEYVFLNDRAGSGNLPDARVYAIEEDKDGIVWVGTAQGIGIYYCPFELFTENSCDATAPIVNNDGDGGKLLESDIVNCITIDNANRKWVGTNNGMWLLSDDGNEFLLNFTTQNSPLPSNRIIGIAPNESTGDVFIGTGNGIMSYRSDATKGQNSYNNVVVFPNPVEPDYDGPVNIKNLVDGSNVKITDVSGNLVYDTKSLGGQVVWNQKDYTGRAVSSGVYLIFATNNDGSQSYEGKLMLIR